MPNIDPTIQAQLNGLVPASNPASQGKSQLPPTTPPLQGSGNTTGGCPYAGIPGVGPALCDAWAIMQAGNTVGSGNLNTGSLGGALVGAIISLFTLPFKLMGINSPQDFFWRLLLVLVGFILLILGLVIIANAAAKDAEESPAGQGAMQAGMAAA